MKHWGAVVLSAMLLLGLTACTGGTATGEQTVDAADTAVNEHIFDFLNGYTMEIAQPGLSEEEKQRAVNTHIDCKAALPSAACSVAEFAYDGSAAYVLIRVTPNEPESVLLMSDFGRSADDRMPGTEQTFRERADAEGKTLVTVGLWLDTANRASGLNETAAFDDAYLADGSLLLYAEYSFSEASDAPRTQVIHLRERGQDGEKTMAELSFSGVPTAALSVRRVDTALSADYGTIGFIEFRRSVLGMSATAGGTLHADVNDAQKQLFSNQTVRLFGEEGELFAKESYVTVFTPRGAPVYIEEIAGGEWFFFRLRLSAGADMPDTVIVDLYDYAEGESTAQYRVSVN